MRYLNTINNTNIEIKEYQGQRVVTFKDVDTVHGRPDGTARKRFSDNREHFIEGEDFFKVKCSEVRPFFGQTPPNDFNPDADIVLVTESGYLMLAKSFTDDKAWQVQRQLVKGYFRAKEAVQLSPAEQLLAHAQLMVEQERRLKALEVSNAENARAMETVQDAIDIMVAPPVTAGNWQSQMNRNIRAFCMQTGLDFHKTREGNVMKEEIKRCPFCDGSAILEKSLCYDVSGDAEDFETVFVQCVRCGARTRGTEVCLPKNADYDWRDCVGAEYEIEAWNARI